ncbi:MAG: EFR1 family ferrodoxin [Deltaproteobacteria bacterium]|nr:EFR1 family ferrodoxin [Deltaproteobacteria bacterium]
MVPKGASERAETSGYRKLELFFMSGTGNSYRNAKWIEAEAKELHLKTNINLVPATHPTSVSMERQTLYGFVMPTHAFTAPWPMIKFVLRLPRARGAHAFSIVGRGGSKAGNTYIPGLEGTACYLMALLLLLKGFSVRGVLAVDMPGNWVVAYPAPSPEKAAGIINRARAKTLAFFAKIMEGKRSFGGWIGLGFGFLLAPISIAYLIVGRFFLAKIFFANNDCNGCGLCARNCSYGGIRMRGLEKPRPYWTYNCENCMRCMAYCPEKAIEAGHSWAVILYFVSSTSVSVYLLNLLAPYTGEIVMNPWLALPLQYAYLLASMAAAYWLFSILLRVPLINSIFTHTTFTHVFRRYHEPETKARDLL